MLKISLVNLVSSTNASNGNTALTGKENVMSENISSTPITPVYFQDSSGSWWETCTAATPNAKNFGPRFCAVRSTPPSDLVRIEDEAEWEVYINADTGNDSNDNECPCMGSNEHCHRCSTWDVPLICKGCGHVEYYEGMDDFCRSCQADGTEHTLRLSLSDVVDAQCKGSSLSDKVDAFAKNADLHVFYSEDEWNEFK
jgi:hypothetical protein